MGSGDDRDLKVKESVVASEAIDQHDGDLRSKEARRRPWEEEGGILRLKKEAEAAWDLWFLTQSSRRKDRETTQVKAQAPGAPAGKKKKVVKTKLRKEYIDYMATCPFTICPDLSDEKLAQYTPDFRQVFAAGKLLEAKSREYHNALIAQYNELGYAEDETEVTDHDGDGEEMVEA